TPASRVPEHSALVTWHAEILLPQEPTVLRYHFVLDDGTILRERRQIEGQARALYGVWEEHDFQLSVYDPNAGPPAWVPGTVMYQIFPDRFARGPSGEGPVGAVREPPLQEPPLQTRDSV